MPEADAIAALPPIHFEDIQAGDVLFFAKESPLQKVFWAVGDLWVHTALVVDVDGRLCTAEVGTAPAVYSRLPSVAAQRYEITGVGRPDLSATCIERATSWAKTQIGSPQDYAWNDFLLAALVALTRKGLPPEVLPELGAAMQDVADDSEQARAQSRTCVGFVHEAYERSGGACALPIDMTDTTRLGVLESTTSYCDLLHMSQAEQSQVLERTTLYDLLAADIARDEQAEGMNGSRLSKRQFGMAMKAAFQVVVAYQTRDSEDEGHLPGCWSSPTDLWRSEQIGYRARVVDRSTN